MLYNQKNYITYYIQQMTNLHKINVKLSKNQKKNIGDAYHKRETIVIRLKNDSFSGNDTLYVPAMLKKRLEKNRKENKGMDIKLSKTNIRKQVGGNLLTSILSLGRVFGPTIAKTMGLAALAGAASTGTSQIVKKISGKGVKTGGFLIPQNKIDKLIANKHLLSKRQKEDILAALQSCSGVVIKPTKTQSGGFLGTLLASIGIPMVLKALTGRGAPKIGLPKPPPPRGGRGAPRIGPWEPPPFIGTWDNQVGMGKKKKIVQKKEGKRSSVRPKQSIQQHSAFRSNTRKPKFHEDIPMSNHDLIKWCRYLNIPINDVLSRDQRVPHNHNQALFIYNLKPSYMNGSHWVATYVKDHIINYFDSFGMPPFQELVNHAKRKNLTLLYQNNQIQNMITTTCGYFCLYFLNEMNKGNSYYNLLKVFSIHDTMKNERFIKYYFKNI